MSEEVSGDSSGPRRRLTDAEFATIVELYELGKRNIAELAGDFGISRQHLSKRLKDAGAKKASRSGEITEAVKAVEESFAAKRAQLIEETRVDGLKSLKQVRMISQKIAIDALRSVPPKPMACVDDDLRSIGRLNKILIDNLSASLNILNANEHVDAEDLPTLYVEDLTDNDILKHHIETGALDEDATIEDINGD